jgi:hypothetical protein
MLRAPRFSRPPTGKFVQVSRSARVPAAVAVVALAAATLVACGGGDDEALAVGAVEASDSGSGDASTVEVTVPTGTFELSVADPTDQVGDLAAPDGGRLLQIGSTFRDGDVRRDVWNLAARGGATKPVSLTVRVGDEEYPAGTLRKGADPGAAGDDVLPPDFVVAVDGDVDGLDDVVLEVGYDGLTQEVHAADGSREPGPADALYDEGTDPAGGATADCGDGKAVPDLQLQVDCRVGPMTQIPYVPGLGWAADGKTWTVVPLAAALTSAEDGAASYTATDASSRTTLDGVAPDSVLDQAKQMGGASYSGQLVFGTASDAAGRLRVAMTWALRLTSGGGAPSAREVDYTAVTDLADLGN